MKWFSISFEETIYVILSAVLIYAILMITVKINGLRSFSKMSSHDFVVTIAIGSILGAVATQETPSLSQGIVAIVTFFIFQSMYSYWRIKRSNIYLENQPLLLMEGSRFIDENLKSSKLTRGDIISKLREANILQLSEIQAVVLEPTGDVSVLHGTSVPEDIILKDVKKTANS